MEQKKKVQIRFQTSSSSSGNINHDFRLSKVSYLRDNLYHNKFENNYFKFQPDELKKQANKSWKEYNEIFKENNKRNLRKGRQSDYLSGVITLSPIINEWLENGKVKKLDLDKAFEKSIPLIQKKIHEIVGDTSIKLSHYVIHYDEKTPHLHFAFNNHTKNGKAVYHIMRNSKRLSEFQDIVGETFKSVGLERGDRKSEDKHMSVRQMHEEELKQLKKAIRTEIKALQSVKKDLKKSIENKSELKTQLDDIDKSIRNARETIKEENVSIDKLTKQKSVLKASIEDLRPVNPDITIYSTDSIIEHITEKNTYTVKDGFLGSKDIEVIEFKNEDKLREILEKYNQDLKKVKNAPVLNQKLEDNLNKALEDLELAEKRAKANLGLSKGANDKVKELEATVKALEATVKELEKELSGYDDIFDRLDEILLTDFDKRINGKEFLKLEEIIERVQSNKEELEIAEDRIKQLEKSSQKHEKRF